MGGGGVGERRGMGDSVRLRGRGIGRVREFVKGEGGEGRNKVEHRGWGKGS